MSGCGWAASAGPLRGRNTAGSAAGRDISVFGVTVGYGAFQSDRQGAALESPHVWGWDPATLEAWATAVGAGFAIVAAVFAGLTWRGSSSEVNARMRPWVGVDEFKFFRGSDGRPLLFVLLKNTGTLPAQKALLELRIEPAEPRPGEQANPIINKKDEEKVLVPQEDGNYTIGLAQYAQLEPWIADKRDLKVEGTFTYALEKKKFKSKFVADLLFSRPVPADKEVDWRWRNTSAT